MKSKTADLRNIRYLRANLIMNAKFQDRSPKIAVSFRWQRQEALALSVESKALIDWKKKIGGKLQLAENPIETVKQPSKTHDFHTPQRVLRSGFNLGPKICVCNIAYQWLKVGVVDKEERLEETAHSRILRCLTQLGHERLRRCPKTPDAWKKAMSASRASVRTNFPWPFKHRCLYCDVSSYNWSVGYQCQPGLRDSCKVPKFTRHQRPFCDALCPGLLSRWRAWQEKLLLLARGRRRSVPGMSTAFLTVISTFRSIFVWKKGPSVNIGYYSQSVKH